MVVCDIIRACVIFSLPFVPSLLYLLLASVVLESLTPYMGAGQRTRHCLISCPLSQLTHANSLSLLAVCALAARFDPLGLATLGAFLATHVPVLEGLSQGEESLALWVDSGRSRSRRS